MIGLRNGAGRAFVSVRKASSKQGLRKWCEELPQERFSGQLTAEKLAAVFVQCVGGNPGAWHARACCCMTRRMIRRHPPDDMVQEACAQALASGVFPVTSLSSLMRWFDIILARTVIGACRKQSAQKRGGASVFETLSLEQDVLSGSNLALNLLEPASQAGSPLDTMIRQESINRVLRAVLSLNDLSSRLILLVDSQDLLVEEAAHELGLSVTAAKCRLSKARQAVRIRLRSKGIEAWPPPPPMGS